MSADIKALLNEKKKANTDLDLSFSALFGINEKRIEKLPIADLREYSKHPFKDYPQDKLETLSADIKENGLIHPIVVRHTKEGYEILSGHSRTQAAALAGFNEIDAIVCNVSDNVATIIVTKSNFMQRDSILPSEKAKSYQLRNEVLKKSRKYAEKNAENLHKYKDLTSHSHDGNEEIYKELEREYNESKSTIFRYLRLNYLIPELLDLVDLKKIGLVMAVELSYIKPYLQRLIHKYFYVDKKEKLDVKIIEKIKLDNLEKEIDENHIDKILRIKKITSKKLGSLTIKSSALKKYSEHFKNEAELQNTIFQLLDTYIKTK